MWGEKRCPGAPLKHKMMMSRREEPQKPARARRYEGGGQGGVNKTVGEGGTNRGENMQIGHGAELAKRTGGKAETT